MLNKSPAFSGFSVKDLNSAKAFYIEKLGLKLEQDEMGLHLITKGNNKIFVYQKDDHEPASFTILNFIVEDIDKAVDDLESKGVTFEQYDYGNGVKTDENGVLRGLPTNDGPNIAWFKDPSGNVLSILQDK